MKVVDLSTDVAGQWAAKLLAMGGADVERPASAERSDALARYLDAYKRMVEWSGPSLLQGADVVFSTFDSGRRTGLAADVSPPDQCVEVMTSTFGASGPYAKLRGGPLAAWAAGGYLAITGEPDREPLIGPEYLCEYVNGYAAALAAEAGLRLRQRSGFGCRIDLSAMETMLMMHQTTFEGMALGEERRRTGRYYEVYPLVARPCRDGYVLLCVVTDEEYDRFLVAIDHLGMLADARFATRDAAGTHRDEFDEAIAGFLEERNADEIVRQLAAHGVVAAKVAEVADVVSNPQLAHRKFLTDGVPGSPVPPLRKFAKNADVVPTARLGARSQGLPLDGVVVIDFTVFWAGPMATHLLSDLGARVIWVERPLSRVDPDLATADKVTKSRYLHHLIVGRKKESIVLDLSTEEGQETARRLVAAADVVVENNRPGVMEGFGLGPGQLCSSNPRLIYVSLSGYGSTGPWAGRRSYGPAIEAASSMEGRTGYPGGEPLRLGHPLPDGVGGLAGAYATLRGLRERETSGLGGWFDISQLETYVAISGEDFVEGSYVPRIGNQSRRGARQGVYPCAGNDEWIAIRLSPTEDDKAFTEITGMDPSDHDRLVKFTAQRGAISLTRTFQRAGIEAFPVLRPSDLLADPQLIARAFLLDAQMQGRTVKLPGTALHGIADPTGAASGFGEHSQHILDELM